MIATWRLSLFAYQRAPSSTTQLLVRAIAETELGQLELTHLAGRSPLPSDRLEWLATLVDSSSSYSSVGELCTTGLDSRKSHFRLV